MAITISSRTPEGEPLQCPVCGQRTLLEVSLPGNDATCVKCGHLLFAIRDRVLLSLQRSLGSYSPDVRIRDGLGLDSVGYFELTVELNELDPRFEAALMNVNATVGDLLRRIPPFRV